MQVYAWPQHQCFVSMRIYKKENEFVKGNDKLMDAFCGMIARSPTNCGSTIDIPRRTLMTALLKCWDFAMLGYRY